MGEKDTYKEFQRMLETINEYIDDEQRTLLERFHDYGFLDKDIPRVQYQIMLLTDEMIDQIEDQDELEKYFTLDSIRAINANRDGDLNNADPEDFSTTLRKILHTLREHIVDLVIMEHQRDDILNDIRATQDDYVKYIHSEEYLKEKRDYIESLKKNVENPELSIEDRKQSEKKLAIIERTNQFLFLFDRINSLGKQELDLIRTSFFDNRKSEYVVKRFYDKLPKFGIKRGITSRIINIEEKCLDDQYKPFNDFFLFFVMRYVGHTDPCNEEDVQYVRVIFEKILDLVYHRFTTKEEENDFLKIITSYLDNFIDYREYFMEHNELYCEHPKRKQKDKQYREERKQYLFDVIRSYGETPISNDGKDLQKQYDTIIEKVKKAKNIIIEDHDTMGGHILNEDGHIYDMKPKNASFLNISKELEKAGIKNNKFMLEVKDRMVVNIDPYAMDSETGESLLTDDEKCIVVEECKNNLWYFLREIVRVQVPDGTTRMFEATQRNIAMVWNYLHKVPTLVSGNRQTWKTTEISSILEWEYLFQTESDINIYAENRSFGRTIVNNLRKNMMALLPNYLINEKVAYVGTENIDKITNPVMNSKVTCANSLYAVSEDRAKTIGSWISGTTRYFNDINAVSYLEEILDPTLQNEISCNILMENTYDDSVDKELTEADKICTKYGKLWDFNYLDRYEFSNKNEILTQDDDCKFMVVADYTRVEKGLPTHMTKFKHYPYNEKIKEELQITEKLGITKQQYDPLTTGYRLFMVGKPIFVEKVEKGLPTHMTKFKHYPYNEKIKEELQITEKLGITNVVIPDQPIKIKDVKYINKDN